MSAQHITVRVSDFRALERLEWTPLGVCLLTGANGSGKTTVLNALSFLRDLFLFGHEAAFRHAQGVAFRRVGVEPQMPVEFEITVGDLRWRLQFPMSARGLKGRFGETLYRGDEPILRAGMFQDEWFLGKARQEHDEIRCCTKVLWDRGESPWMRPLVTALSGFRVYYSYWMNQITRFEPTQGADSYLHPTAKNLWSVLANWKAAPMRYAGRFEWVIQTLRAAFPGLVQSIEFDRGLPYLFKPGVTDFNDGLPPFCQADGLLTGLAHLTAVAGADRGALLAFDEMENQLHPHAIRTLLTAMRQRAEAYDLTIILTTHSPVVLNEFKGEEARVYVLERGWSGTLPVALDEIHDESWLASFELGALYERDRFAAPIPRRDR